MKPLKEKFKLGGFDFSMLTRADVFAVFAKERAGRTHYEVVTVQKQRASEFRGIKFEERERYPRNEEFGAKAWCYTDKEDAFEKFHTLVSARDKGK